MEVFYLIVNTIGFIALAWYIWVLQKQIKSQKDTLDSQNKAFENLKMLVDIFQPEKVREFVKMRELTFEDKKNKELEEIKLDIQRKSQESPDMAKFISAEWDSLLTVTLNLFYYLPPEIRKMAVHQGIDSLTKIHLLRATYSYPYHGNVFRNALTRFLSEQVLSSNIADLPPKTDS